jgi:uncharacterized protein YlxW (UPF0749 family)
MGRQSKHVIATTILIFLICAAIFKFLFSGSNVNLNSSTRNDVLFDEIQRLRDALSIANQRIANDADRIKQLRQELDSFKLRVV